MKILKKCIPSAFESVYREIFVPHRETVRLSSKPWDLRGLLLDWGEGCPMLWQIYASHYIVIKILCKSIRIENKKYNEKLNKAMHKFVRVLDKYGWVGQGEDMYVPSLNFKYGHFPFQGVAHVPLPSWYLPMLQFHVALMLLFRGHVAKRCVIIGCTYVWSSSEIKLINNYFLSLNGLWVNTPWGWRSNRLFTQRPWG